MKEDVEELTREINLVVAERDPVDSLDFPEGSILCLAARDAVSDRRRESSIPVRGGSFPTTRWSLVFAVGGSSVSSGEALESLCQIYWPPVYAFARYRGYSTDHAEDLTQGFFTKLLEKNYAQQADRDRGKFRTFLLSSFKNYMANEWDRFEALKRGGGHWVVSLDSEDAERGIRVDSADNKTPEKVRCNRWKRHSYSTRDLH